MHHPRRLLALALASCLALPIAAEPPASPPSAATLTSQTTLTPEQIREDLDVLRRAYTALHPGLLRYNTPEQLDASWAALERDLAQGATLGQTYLRLSRFLATLKCGHSYANFSNQRKAVAAALFHGVNRVPFAFRWFEGDMIVTRPLDSASPLKPGDRIVAINSTPTAEILSSLMTIARADGSNDAKRRRLLEVSGLEEWETFDIFYPMFYPVGPEGFDLTLRDATGAERRIRVAAQSHEDRKAQIATSRTSLLDAARRTPDAVVFEEGFWEFRTLPEGVAYFRMPSWGFYNTKADWAQWIHDRADQLIASGTRDLIVDIRGNEGGMDCGDVLIERLIDAPLAKPAFERRVVAKAVPADLNTYLDTWDDSFRDWGSAAKPRPEGGFVLDRGSDSGDDNTIRPSHTRFTGRVWLLVDGVNSSATFQFAWIMSRSKLATLVGEPTGGNQRGINGGAFFFLRLPNTTIEVDLPLIGIFPIPNAGEPPAPDAGVTPDFLAPVTPEDVRTGNDAALRLVLDRIRRGG